MVATLRDLSPALPHARTVSFPALTSSSAPPALVSGTSVVVIPLRGALN